MVLFSSAAHPLLGTAALAAARGRPAEQLRQHRGRRGRDRRRPYFGHPEADLALVGYFQPVPDDVLAAYQEILPVDRGFVGRRELWRLPAYLAVLAVAGGTPFSRAYLDRLAVAVRTYR